MHVPKTRGQQFDHVDHVRVQDDKTKYWFKPIIFIEGHLVVILNKLGAKSRKL